MTEGQPAEVDLAQAEFFRSLSAARLALIRPFVRERRFKRRSTLFHEGQPAEFLWAVRRGEIRLLKTTSEGRSTTLETIHPGEIFGAVAAFEGREYPATAEAAVESTVWRLSRVALLGLLHDEPLLMRELMGIVARRLRGAHTRLRSFAHDPADARLAQALLGSARQDEVHVTRRELAEATGMTVETAIRTLRRFERDGLLHGEVGLLKILDVAALRRIAGAREDPDGSGSRSG